MSLAVWPSISPEDLKTREAESLVCFCFPQMPTSFVSIAANASLAPQKNELDWILDESLETCKELKHGLEDCYALLAPIDPGSTLVMSTPRNEKVKGTITRVGTRIVKGVRISPLSPPLHPFA